MEIEYTDQVTNELLKSIDSSLRDVAALLKLRTLDQMKAEALQHGIDLLKASLPNFASASEPSAPKWDEILADVRKTFEGQSVKPERVAAYIRGK